MSTDKKKNLTRASRREDSPGPGRNDLEPDISSAEGEVEEISLEIVPGDDAPSKLDLSRGFDPYDTGAFYKK